MSRYVELSKQIHQIFQGFTPQIEPVSIDKAFLDVTGAAHLFGTIEKLGRKIKSDIKEKTDFTASVGIAPNKFLAKPASGLEKPDAVSVVGLDIILMYRPLNYVSCPFSTTCLKIYRGLVDSGNHNKANINSRYKTLNSPCGLRIIVDF